MRMRSALPMLALAVACAPWHHQTGGASAVVGSGPALQPRLSAAVVQQRDFMLTVRLPRSGYVTALWVVPDRNVSLLAPADGEEATRTEVDAGSHTLRLRVAPLFFGQSAVRAIDETGRWATAQRYGVYVQPRPDYALVVVTAKPVSWQTAQDALADVELVGDSPKVLARIARAVGDASGGEWSAASRKTSFLSAPF